MKVNLITDAKYHNLALMKISAFYKAHENQVYLNGVGEFDRTVGSWLYDFSPKPPCTYEGGPAIHPTKRHSLDGWMPDYDLFGLDYSLGYTWEYCPRKCPFCIVPHQNNPQKHHSIWDFHQHKFQKICLLNNNTFSDPQWKETFEEIWDADLIVRDENGYDLRLMDEEKAEALKRTRFAGYIHYAWDLIENESAILRGLRLAPRGMVYVLVGFNTTEEEDFYRCQKIHDLGHDPYIMPFKKKDRHLYALKRFIDARCYRQYPTIKEAWNNYRYKE